MLMRPTKEKGVAGKAELEDRLRRFLLGEWSGLVREASEDSGRENRKSATLTDEEKNLKRRREAEEKVRLKEISRARTHLTSLGLAPGTPETLAELTNEAKRPRTCLEPIPGDILNFSSGAKVILEPNLLENVLRSSGRGSAPDLSGTRYEHIRVLLDEEADWAVAALFFKLMPMLKSLQTLARVYVSEE